MKPIISASILSADFSNLAQEIIQCERGGVDWIHVDVMDGHFVPNLTMGPFIVESIRKITTLPIDCHLMVDNPENLVNAFVNAGASTITIHPENNPNVHRTLQMIKALGCKTGVAINPGTPGSFVSSLIPFVDLVLIMTVNPGYSGQVFIPEMTQKIIEIVTFASSKGSSPIIEVDGGINTDTLPIAYHAGAQAFVASTAIFKYPEGISEGIRALLSAKVN
jgi:ribulose-phosphate 3-epimerase